MSGYTVNRRDRFTQRVCNWIINHIASREYRAFIGVTTHWGTEQVNRWVEAGCPDDWSNPAKVNAE